MPDGGKIAVLVVLESDLPVPLLQPLAKQIAMHIGAANPAFLSIEDVDEESLRMEREIFHAQAASAGKSEEVMAKMVEGKVQKYYQDVVLLEQAFIMDNKIKIKDLIKNFETKHGEKVILQDFARYEVGEGI
jgi:elongation factor Ts